MNKNFHNRLAGTIIVVVLGVIFIPDLLDGQKVHYKEDSTAIPLTPQNDKGELQIDVLQPQSVEVELPKSQAVTLQDDTTAIDPLDAVVAKVRNRDKQQALQQENAWVIQVGFFRSRSNAELLAKKLKNKGYVSHVYPSVEQKDTLNRVVIGPELNRKKLDNVQQKVEKDTGLKVRVVQFDPLDI